MSDRKVTKVDSDEVRAAIKKVASHRLHTRMLRVDHEEAHRILPEIWPIINELCVLADACEAQMITVNP